MCYVIEVEGGADVAKAGGTRVGGLQCLQVLNGLTVAGVFSVVDAEAVAVSSSAVIVWFCLSWYVCRLCRYGSLCQVKELSVGWGGL